MNKDAMLKMWKAREGRDFEPHTIELVMCALELTYEQLGLEGFVAELNAISQLLRNVPQNPEQKLAAMRHYITTLPPDVTNRLEQSGQLVQIRAPNTQEARKLLADPEALTKRVALLMELPDDATRH